jgi:hypothetical protein
MISESRLQQQCFMWHWNSYPDQRGRLWMNHNNPKNRIHGAILKGMGLLAGVSDLTFLREDGRCVFIEMKLPGERQSPKQKKWESLVDQCNAFYHVVRTESEFKEVINRHASIKLRA